MEKIVFKNTYLNIVLGALLLAFAFVGYFTNLIENYTPIIIGVVLILLSVKRFVYSFKKIISKNATLILVVEILLDFVFAGLLIYLQDHIELFVGLIIYTRGVSYLIINYVATRKVRIFQYVINILYVTFGSFLMFTSYSSAEFLAVFIFILTLIVGAIFLQIGVKKVVLKEKQEELQEEEEKRKEKLEIVEAKSEKKITKLQNKLDEVVKEQKIVSSQSKKNEKITKKEEHNKTTDLSTKSDDKVNYEAMTIAELKVVAKERNITGLSQLNKSEIIAKLKK